MAHELLDDVYERPFQKQPQTTLLSILMMVGGSLQVIVHLKTGYDWIYNRVLWFIPPTYGELTTFITAGVCTAGLGWALWSQKLPLKQALLLVFFVQVLVIALAILVW